MPDIEYICNNPDIVKITCNDKYNIFVDTKMNIVYLKGTDKNGKTKQIKLGQCNELINNSNDCNQCAITPICSQPNILCNEMFKYIGFFTNYEQLINQTKNKIIDDLAIALVNNNDHKIKLYIYCSSNKIWTVVGIILDLSNIMPETTCITKPICSYNSSSISCSTSTSSKSDYDKIVQTNYILFKPEFIEPNKLKQIYVDQLNNHLPHNKYYIKFNDIRCFPCCDKFIVDGKYIVNYNISFCYKNECNNDNDDTITTATTATTISYDTIVSKSNTNKSSSIEKEEEEKEEKNELLDINKNGTLIMICKINKDTIEILSSSIKNVTNNNVDYPIATTHSFLYDFKYGNNIILLIYPLTEINDNIKLNILQNSTFVKMKKID